MFYILILFLKILGLENWGTSDPEIHLAVPEHLKKTPFNFTCRFAVGTLLYVTLYIVQVIIPTISKNYKK